MNLEPINLLEAELKSHCNKIRNSIPFKNIEVNKTYNYHVSELAENLWQSDFANGFILDRNKYKFIDEMKELIKPSSYFKIKVLDLTKSGIFYKSSYDVVSKVRIEDTTSNFDDYNLLWWLTYSL